jgi:hypothetical protein
MSRRRFGSSRPRFVCPTHLRASLSVQSLLRCFWLCVFSVFSCLNEMVLSRLPLLHRLVCTIRGMLVVSTACGQPTCNLYAPLRTIEPGIMARPNGESRVLWSACGSARGSTWEGENVRDCPFLEEEPRAKAKEADEERVEQGAGRARRLLAQVGGRDVLAGEVGGCGRAGAGEGRFGREGRSAGQDALLGREAVGASVRARHQMWDASLACRVRGQEVVDDGPVRVDRQAAVQDLSVRQIGRTSTDEDARS